MVYDPTRSDEYQLWSQPGGPPRSATGGRAGGTPRTATPRTQERDAEPEFDITQTDEFQLSTAPTKPTELEKTEPSQATKPVETTKAVKDFAKAVDMSETAAAKTIARFQKTPDSKEFGALSDSQYDALKRAAQSSLKQTTVDVGGQLVDRRAWNALPEQYQSIAIREGLKSMQDAIKRDETKFYTENVKLPDGTWIPEKSLKQIRKDQPGLEPILIKRGYNAYLAAVERHNKAAEEQKAYDMRKQSHVADTDRTRTREMYVNVKTGKEIASTQLKNLTGMERDLYVKKDPKNLQLAAEMVVPFVYTAKHWKEMPAAEKALWLAIDVAATALPVAGAAIKGSRGVVVAGRTQRLLKGAKAGLLESGRLALAPVEMIAHPLETVTGVVKDVRNVGEILLHPKRIPSAVIGVTDSTVRLRVNDVKDVQKAKEARDALVSAASKTGKNVYVEAGGYRIELPRSAIMKASGGGLVHTSPMGEMIEKGLIVKPKKGMSKLEQGLYVSHEPLSRFAEASAFGRTGDKPIFFIYSAETAKKAVPSGKIYRGTAEMELKFPVGTKLPAANQMLFTRIGPTGNKAFIALEKPLSAAQIAKLKGLGVIEALKTPFTPAIKVKEVGEKAKEEKLLKLIIKERVKNGRKSFIIEKWFDTGKKVKVTAKDVALNKKKVKQVAEILRQSGNVEQARRFANAFRYTTTHRQAMSGLARAARFRTSTPVKIKVRVPTKDVTRITKADRITPVTAIRAPRMVSAQLTARKAITRGRVEKVQNAIRLLRERMDKLQRTMRPGLARTEAEARIGKGMDRLRAELKRLKREQGRIKRDTPRVERPHRPPVPPRPPRPPRTPVPPRPPRPPRIPPDETPPVTLPGKGATDQQKREYIAAVGGVTQNMGKLHGKDVWHTKVPGRDKPIVTLGKKPQGATDAEGKGSAYRTTQTIGGLGKFKPFSIQHGFMKSRIKPVKAGTGAKASFSPGFKSVKKGRQFFTKLRGGTAISRRPLGRHNK